MYKQISYDIFFVDMESNKELIVKNLNGVDPIKYRGAWRLINLVNKWVDIQTYNFYSSVFSYSILIFAWYYLEWHKHAVLSPHLKIVVTKSPEHFILKYFMTSFVILLVGLGYTLVRYVISSDMFFYFPLKTTEFVDLCTISNISILILDDDFHGYYIYGKLPGGESDVSLEELSKKLDDEGEGNLKSRNLAPNSNSQEFEIYVSYKFRNLYNSYFNYLSNSKVKMNVEMTEDEYKEEKKKYSDFQESLSKCTNSEKNDLISKIRLSMNLQIKEDLNNVILQPEKHIRETTLMMRFLGMTSVEITKDTRENMIFFNGSTGEYLNVLFSGIQWELYIWWLYWFLFILLISDSVGLGVFIVFCLDLASILFKDFFSKKNIAYKSLIPESFIL